MSRHHSRTLAMQALCQWEVLGESFMAQLDEFLSEESPPQEVAVYARKLVKKTTDNAAVIDAHIQDAASNWKLDRIAPVDRSILRIAVCELLYRTDIPHQPVVNEAIELGKAFGAAESAAFINGVLDAVIRKQKSSTGAADGTV